MIYSKTKTTLIISILLASFSNLIQAQVINNNTTNNNTTNNINNKNVNNSSNVNDLNIPLPVFLQFDKVCVNKKIDRSYGAATALQVAALKVDKIKVKELLIEQCVTVEMMNQFNLPAYYFAPDLETLSWYIARGVNIFSAYPKNNTLLLERSTSKEYSWIDEQIDLRDFSSEGIAGLKKYHIDDKKLIQIKIKTDSFLPDLVNQSTEKFLLIKNNNGNTALHNAILFGLNNTVDAILKKNNELIKIKNNDNKTPLELLYSSCLNDNEKIQLFKTIVKRINTSSLFETVPVPKTTLALSFMDITLLHQMENDNIPLTKEVLNLSTDEKIKKSALFFSTLKSNIHVYDDIKKTFKSDKVDYCQNQRQK